MAKAKRAQGLHIKCDVCSNRLRVPGALLFSPPTQVSQASTKFHICTACYPQLRHYMRGFDSK